MTEEERADKQDQEVLPPARDDATSVPGNIYADIAAQINQYTDRPDLFLEAIERHDPGFIKGMNDEAREFSRKNRLSRFYFAGSKPIPL